MPQWSVIIYIGWRTIRIVLSAVVWCASSQFWWTTMCYDHLVHGWPRQIIQSGLERLITVFIHPHHDITISYYIYYCSCSDKYDHTKSSQSIDIQYLAWIYPIPRIQERDQKPWQNRPPSTTWSPFTTGPAATMIELWHPTEFVYNLDLLGAGAILVLIRWESPSWSYLINSSHWLYLSSLHPPMRLRLTQWINRWFVKSK